MIVNHNPYLLSLNSKQCKHSALSEKSIDHRTIITAVMCGTDTDCSSGTRASIIGAAVGYNNLDPRWVEPLHVTVRSAVAEFGASSIRELVQRTIALRKKLF